VGRSKTIEVAMRTSKRCWSCKTSKPIEDFALAKDRYDGRRSECRACSKIRLRRYIQFDRTCTMCGISFLGPANQDMCSRDCAQRWQREILRFRGQTCEIPWRQCRGCQKWFISRGALARRRVYHNAACAQTHQRSRVVRKVVKVSYPSLLEHFRQYGNECFYCGSQIALEADHVIPVSKGGGDELRNLVPSCHLCNSHKNAFTIDEWRDHMARRLRMIEQERRLIHKRLERLASFDPKQLVG
jgi:5-methylcytosine-specific restriction endonuclease McrA